MKVSDIAAECTTHDIVETDEKTTSFEYMYDWFNMSNYTRYFKKKPNAQDIEHQNNEWGVRRIHDGIFRDGVPQFRLQTKSGQGTFRRAGSTCPVKVNSVSIIS